MAKCADVFLLTSLVDPYPLVMLEAAYLQKPIIAFIRGGVSEFVKKGMGKIVSYYCVEKLKNAIEEFISEKIIINKDLLKREAEKHDIKIKISEFEDMILKYI
ncbi:MAG: glycosyltransferase [Bacteroidales bacterium]|nr:glycosyltransferase [Bacteroidales bacterium]